MSSDMISRQDAIEACMKYNGQGHIWSCIMGNIEKLPSAESIIRCRDCKWYDTTEEMTYGYQTFYDADVDYCSLAERKDNE